MRNKVIVLLLFLAFCFLTGEIFAQQRTVRIGRVTDGPYYYARECWERFKQEMEVLGGEDYLFLYPDEYQLIDDWKKETIKDNCRILLAAGEIDIIVGMGLNTAAFFATQTELPKPVVLFGTMDIEMAGLETAAGRSTIKNLTFQVHREKISRELEKIKRMARGEEITVLIDPTVINNIPDFEKNAIRLGEEAGLKYRFVALSDTVDRTLEELPPDTGFIYLIPSDRFNTRPKIEKLLEGLNERKVPTFAMEGVPIVEMGALAGLYRGGVEKIAKNNALKVYEILKGEPPERQSVYFRDPEEFTINMATARRIDYYPDFDLLMEARLINERVEEGPLITFRAAVAIALDNNLSYQIARRELEEEQQEYKKILANLFPQLEVSADYQRIDSDRAKASIGLLPRWEAGGSLKLEQLIFDYAVWKSVALARRSVSVAESELERTKLDTVESALLAYLNVLQARELERIQKENLASTRNHLETARVRLEQEVGSREDVLRWEAQYKEALASVIEADFNLRKTSLVFNEVLDRPQEAFFRLEPLSRDGYSVFSGAEIDRILTNYRQSGLVRNFLVKEGKELAPEMILARLNLEIAEQDLIRSRAEIWSPTLAAQFEYTRKFDEEVWNPDGMGGGSWGGSGDYPDDNEWSVVAYVSLPLWTGGSRWADLGQKKVTLRKAEESLRLQEQSTALSIRSAYFDLAASSTNWELNQKREDLARETLKLVEDKYQKGTLPIIDLLDAQSDYLSAQAAAVSAFYSSISDLIILERETGFIEYHESPEDVERFISAMVGYVEEQSQ